MIIVHILINNQVVEITAETEEKALKAYALNSAYQAADFIDEWWHKDHRVRYIFKTEDLILHREYGHRWSGYWLRPQNKVTE